MERPLSSLSMLGRFRFPSKGRCRLGCSSWEVGVDGEGRTLRRRVTLICAGYARKPESDEAQSRMTVLRREATLSNVSATVAAVGLPDTIEALDMSSALFRLMKKLVVANATRR